MKKILSYAALICAAMTFAACGDDEPTTVIVDETQAADLDYKAEYAEQWGNYMLVVSNLLEDDAQTLYDLWTKDNNGEYPQSYANLFKNPGESNTLFRSANDCVEQILDGCIDIAGEVSSQKIGEPYRLYIAGKRTEALYAVESWYSFHSREDYRNNIYSVRNAFYGSLDGTVNENSLSAVLQKLNPELNARATALIDAAARAIWAIPDPFRNNIGSPEVLTAMEACAELEDFIKNELKPYFSNNVKDEAVLLPVIRQYIDGVVLPTYAQLVAGNAALNEAVKAFKRNPTNDGFEACALAWLNARQPWEQSEAFLFGPVADRGLDPNMDSWPLDQSGIAAILNSQDFAQLQWSGDYEELDEENEDASSAQAKAIAKAQNLRGYHTLEYFIFKNGQARKVN